MSQSTAFEILRKTIRDGRMSDYKDKSDSELESIQRHHAIALSAGNYSNEAEGYKLLGEMDACKDILERRKAAQAYSDSIREALAVALENWSDTLASKRKTAMQNLRFATSYLGQLVAAVLEEESDLTAEQIKQWSDDLAKLPDSEYMALLKGLVNERILLVREGRYSLLTLCIPNLFPSDPERWIESFAPTDKELGKFYDLLLQTQRPATEQDWILQNGSHYDQDRLKRNSTFVYSSATRKLDEYVSQGLLSKTPVADSPLNLYYFPMLGEGRN